MIICFSGGCTSLAQPVDVSIYKPFKDEMRELWMEWRKSGNARTRQGNLKQPTRQNALNWVAAAWESIAEGIVVHSFLCCGISSSLDGSEGCHIRDCIPTVDDDSDGDGEGEEEDEEVDWLGVLDEEEEATVEEAAVEGEATVEEAAVEGVVTVEEKSTAAEQL